MINGIQFQALPVRLQRKTLSEWMGCADFIWNAKCEEEEYQRTFARKYLPIGTYPVINQEYAQYKNDELSPWLKDCPSQILRNSTSNWYKTYQNFLKGYCKRPKRKYKNCCKSILLTRELFFFQEDEKTKSLKLFIGTKTNNIGFLKINWHDKSWLKYGYPNSIRIKKTPYGRYTVSFCYGEEEKTIDNNDWLEHLKSRTPEELDEMVLGIDRGIRVICATDQKDLQLTAKPKEKQNLVKYEKRVKKYQRHLARCQKFSKRSKKVKRKIAKAKAKKANLRKNICHHVSKKLVEAPNKQVLVFEDLQTKNMTKSAKGTVEQNGKNVRQKSGLNREILNIGWHQIEVFTNYKARRVGKIVFKIDPKYTSQECAHCGHTHPENRKGTQFNCIKCGYTDNADHNAAEVIKKRAIKLFLDSGTESDGRGVLTPKAPSAGRGRGSVLRPAKTMSLQAMEKKRLKRRIA